MHVLLTTPEMADADRLAVAAGIPSLTLMENAGRAVADEAVMMVRPGARLAVLCGPGNNGGDGFVAARLLRARGFDVRLSLLGERAALKADAAEMAGQWPLPIRPASPDALQGMHLIIDALFGAGLKRPLDGAAAELVAAINASGLPVLAVDVPSGLDGTTGQAAPSAVQATRTVTFFRKKPGHLLLPGRALCGEIVVADIGIPDGVIDAIKPSIFEDNPALWMPLFPSLRLDTHKYGRGHALVATGPPHQTGASRLGARGALRIGAGLVTVAGTAAATAVNAAHLTAIMLAHCNRPKDLEDLLSDRRKTAVLLGPGFGVGGDTCDFVFAALSSHAAVVLDADALTSFAGDQGEQPQPVRFGFTGSTSQIAGTPAALFAVIRARPENSVVLTPHAGEFRRLFGVTALDGPKLDAARRAAADSGAIVVLKGADTVIAGPDGRAAINANAPPWLATAGSGDVLAGFVTGLLAQGMPAFESAAAAVWLHGACATAFGPGLIAEDLPEMLPKVLASLRA